MKTTFYLSDTLIKIIEPILKKIVQLRNELKVTNPRIEHSQIIELLRECKSQLRLSKIEPSLQEIIHFMLCAAIDEAFLSNGNSQVFVGQSGTSLFHQNIDSGETFFENVESHLAKESKNIIVLGLALTLLNLGFQGKYAIIENGKEKLSLIRKKLFDAIPHTTEQNFINDFALKKNKSSIFPYNILITILIFIALIGIFYAEYSRLNSNVYEIVGMLNNKQMGVTLS